MRPKRLFFHDIHKGSGECDDCSDFIEAEWNVGEQPGGGAGFVPKCDLRLDKQAFGHEETRTLYIRIPSPLDD